MSTAQASGRKLSYYINRYLPWILLAPVLIHLAIFRYLPTLSAFYYSLTNWNGIKAAKFVGLRNYTELFTDYVFLDGLRNMNIRATASDISSRAGRSRSSSPT